VPILYLSGVVNPALPPDVGVMRTPAMGNRLPAGRVWSADTGCYANPAGFDFGAYLRWLDGHDDEERARCLFAAAPDIPRDWPGTIARALPRLREVRAVGYPVALVLQDGATPDQMPWDGIDAVFVGGTTAWKLSPAADAIVAEANRRGIHAHSGRVNSLRRLRAVAMQGCDSADGTFCKWPDANIPRLAAWLAAIERQPCLPLVGGG
jgi:hypothetical protein